MSANRFRQIARLEKSAKPYLARKSRIKREWPLTLRGVAAHAAVLAFLVRYGNPRIEEPLSCAIERCAESAAWKECCDEFNLTSEVIRERNSFRVVTRDAVATIGDPLRHVIISSFPGPDEKQKLDRAFAAAPPWLLWFTFADYSAELLGLTLPDLSEVSGFMRSKEMFHRWWGFPRGMFECKPWPYGKEHEPLARTDLNLLLPKTRSVTKMTPRELRRERAISMRSDHWQPGSRWPYLFPIALLKMPEEELLRLNSRRFEDFHHPLMHTLVSASTRRR
jgi:hypothetical protein